MANIEIRDEIARTASGVCASRDFGYEEALEVADAILSSPVIRRIQVEAIREYGKALSENRSALCWGLGDFLYDIEDWAKEIEK